MDEGQVVRWKDGSSWALALLHGHTRDPNIAIGPWGITCCGCSQIKAHANEVAP